MSERDVLLTVAEIAIALAGFAGELGFDAVINYKSQDLHAALRETCPDGIDVYFDNVGGATLDTVLRRINQHARIVICGMISEYNLTEPELAPRPTRSLLVNRARMQGFIVTDFLKRYPEGLAQMAAWLEPMHGSGAGRHRF